MEFSLFKLSIDQKAPPEDVNIVLKALWYDAKGDWKAAHNIVQMQEGIFAYDRIHAYLHRKEGDLFNAKWWYSRLKLQFPLISLAQEWEILVKENL
jgi:hypothetical protein